MPFTWRPTLGTDSFTTLAQTGTGQKKKDPRPVLNRELDQFELYTDVDEHLTPATVICVSNDFLYKSKMCTAREVFIE